MTVSLVTCVTNKMGMGPGHSCVDLDGTIYTFENQADWGGGASGWLRMSRATYLSKNEDRPVIFQRLIGAVDTAKAHEYIQGSIADDEDYGSSGVCSSQAANAIEAGWGKSFNVILAIDTPYRIYQLARRKGIVTSERMYWPGEDDCNFLVRNRIKVLLAALHIGVADVM